MTGEATIFWFAVAAVGLGLSALFSGMETGAYSVNVVRLMVRARGRGRIPGRRRAARLLREFDKQDRMLATLLIGNNIANYLGAMGVSALLTGAGFSDWGIVAINAAILTPMLFVFGETLPKDYFRANADRLMPRMTPALVATRWLTTATLALPIVRLFAAVVSRVMRGSNPAEVASTRARVAALLKEGRRHGVLSDSQTKLVDRAMRLRELRVEDEMTPWDRVVTLRRDASRAEINEMARRTPHGHYPVVDRSGNVLGLVRSIELFIEKDRSLTDLLSPVVRIDAGTPLVDAVLTLRSERIRHAVVVERGRTIGFIAERDLLEPLLGEIKIT